MGAKQRCDRHRNRLLRTLDRQFEATLEKQRQGAGHCIGSAGQRDL
jgi:hypothetical protein